jgi:hypothetical protein
VAIVDDDIWVHLGIDNCPEPSGSIPNDLLIEDGAMEETMTKETESKEGMSHPFGEEDAAHFGGYVCECVSHAANNDVLENCRILREWGLLFRLQAKPLVHELEGQLKHCV